MRKCEKDFDRKVFSFLYILLDALPLFKYMIDRNCNKLGCIGFSVATTNYIKSYGKQSAVPTMSQVLKSFKEKARYTVSLKKQGWVKRVARINPSATK